MSEKPGKQLRVLVVDDQPAVREVVAETIRYAGHDVVGIATDGVEAVEQASQLRPDLVLMDIHMPRQHGDVAMRAILAAGTARRVALMSGEWRSLGLSREGLLKEGAAAFLEKPFNVNELFSLLEKWAAESPQPAH